MLNQIGIPWDQHLALTSVFRRIYEGTFYIGFSQTQSSSLIADSSLKGITITTMVVSEQSLRPSPWVRPMVRDDRVLFASKNE